MVELGTSRDPLEVEQLPQIDVVGRCVGYVFWFLGRFVFKSGKELVHVHWHGDVHVTLCVVPFEGDSAVECTVPILFECVVCAECIDEVVGMLLSFIFDSKVING